MTRCTGKACHPSGTSGVYSITCTANGWIYIGSSVSIRQRWSTHRSWLQNGTHNVPQMQADWDEHGEAAFQFSLLADEQDKEYRLKVEQQFIDAQMAKGNCYNHSPSARDGKGYRFTVEQRSRVSTALKGKPKSDEHRANLWKNREVTAEFREQMAANGRKLKGKPKSKVTRTRIGDAQRGSRNQQAKLTEDIARDIWCRVMSGEKGQDLAREFSISSGTVSQIKSGQLWGHATSDLRRAQAISTANRGVPKTDEHRAKLGEAHRKYWADREITPELSARFSEMARIQGSKPKSAETRRRMSEAQKGRSFTPEHLASLRAAKANGGKPLKLTVEQAAAIKRRAVAGEPVAALAREFGVKPASVSDIKHGRSWRHIQL